MSQYYLLDVSVYPKSGFVFKDPDTNVVLVAGSFETLLTKAISHRKKNRLNIPDNLADQVHAFICSANGNNPGLCSQEKTFKGLGDVVHMFAQPIARAIDATFGTKVSGCRSCAKRREALNRAVPFKH